MKNIEYIGLPYVGAVLKSVEHLDCIKLVLSSEDKGGGQPYLLANSRNDMSDRVGFTDAVTGEKHFFYRRYLVSEHPVVLMKAVYDVSENMAHLGKGFDVAKLVRFYESDFKTELVFDKKWIEQVPKSHLKKLDYLVVR